MIRFLSLALLLSVLSPATQAMAQTRTATGQQPTAQAEKIPTVEEPATEIAFPVRLKVGNKGASSHELIATGVRKKTIFRVKVYAYGMYLDTAAAAPLVQPYMKKTTKKLLKDREFERALLSGKAGMSVRLVMARNVDADDMAEAFDDSLKPRIKGFMKKSTPEETEKAMKTLETFRGLFTTKLKKKDELIFTWLPGGKLHTRIQGKDQQVITSPALTWALFDVYLGEDPISDGGKENFVKALPKAVEKAAAAKKATAVGASR